MTSPLLDCKAVCASFGLRVCQFCRIEEAETNLRKLLVEHKQMYTAEQQQQELEEHQQAAAQQRTAEARHRSRR